MSSWGGEIRTCIKTQLRNEYSFDCSHIYFGFQEYTFGCSSYPELLMRIIYNHFISERLLDDSEFNPSPEESEKFVNMVSALNLEYKDISDYEAFASHPIWERLKLKDRENRF